MANLANLMAQIPGNKGDRYKGVITGTQTALTVNVNGNTIPVRWADPITVQVGDPVLVMIWNDEAIVMGRLTEKPRPGTGTVKTVPVGSPTITVTGSDNIDYVASFEASYTPVVNDAVTLAWYAGIPNVIGKVGTTAAPQAYTTPVSAPPTITSGQSTYWATDSATWSPSLGVWDSWAGGQRNVYQGTWSGYTLYGSWFYAGSPTELSGRTISRVQFKVGARLMVGNYNQPDTFHFYAHSSTNRPGGDVSRVVGPFDVVIQPASGTFIFDLPTSFASTITGGGGISIAGESYGGVKGIQLQPDSGLLIMDWSK